MPQEVTLTTEEKVLATVQPLTEAGNPAAIDGPVQFVVMSGTCTVVGVDDTSAYVVSGTDAGDSTISVTADADLGSGTTHISDVLTAHVVSAQAERLGMTLGEPELK